MTIDRWQGVNVPAWADCDFGLAELDINPRCFMIIEKQVCEGLKAF